MAQKTLLDKFKTYAPYAALAPTGLALPYGLYRLSQGDSDTVKAASRQGALKGAAEGATAGAGIGAGIGTAALPGVGTIVGAAAGLSIGATAGFLKSRSDAKSLEADQKRIESQQEQIAKQAARQQQQLSREAAGQAQKKGSTKVPPPPSNIMLEAAGTGSDFDAWHSRTF